MKKFLIFSAVVCGVSWLAALLFHLITGYNGYPLGNPDGYAAMMIFSTSYMFLPLICAYALHRQSGEKFSSTGLIKFKVNKWWFVAWLTPLAVIFLSLIANMPFASVSFTNIELPAELLANINNATNGTPLPENFSGILLIITIVSGLFAGISVNAIAAFGEEYGWRNYMVHALRNVKFWKASMLIGTIWGLWHFPIILMGHNYPEDRIVGIPLMTIMCILLGIIELYFVLKTRSVIPAAIFHGTFNALAGSAVFFVKDGNSITSYVTGVSGFIAMIITIVAIWAYDHYISREKIFCRTLGDSLERE